MQIINHIKETQKHSKGAIMKNEYRHECGDNCRCGHVHNPKERAEEETRESSKNNKQETQQMYLEFQMLTQQREQLQTQIQNFDSQIVELESIKESLKELEKVEDNTELYVPVSSGIFVSAKIQNAKKLLVNVGSGTVASKSTDEAAHLLESQAGEINEMKNSLIVQLVANSVKLKKLQQKLLKLIE